MRNEEKDWFGRGHAMIGGLAGRYERKVAARHDGLMELYAGIRWTSDRE